MYSNISGNDSIGIKNKTDQNLIEARYSLYKVKMLFILIIICFLHEQQNLFVFY